jgi:hypothetical protein
LRLRLPRFWQYICWQQLNLVKPINDNPWEPWYDKAFGFVVVAKDEADARKFADADAGDENRGEFLDEKIANTKNPWLDEKYTTCQELSANGKEGVIMKDFSSA